MADTTETQRGAQGPDARLEARWPLLAACPPAIEWLSMLRDLGRSPRTIDAYARAVGDYLDFCARAKIEPETATRADVARYVGDLRSRPRRQGRDAVAINSDAGLANATMRLRLAAVRLLYDYLVEEGIRDRNPVARGRLNGAHAKRALIPPYTRLPWIPTDDEWRSLLAVAASESLRTRLMLALAYDAALRRSELCLLRTDDLDPAHRTLTIRAETTKTRRARVVPYSAVSGELLSAYLSERRALTRERGPLFRSESHRNRGQPISVWTWSKAIRSLALRAQLPAFSTHTLRHLCLTDLARSGWELHQIAAFAGHRQTETTLQYIHLSGRDLARRLERSMASPSGDRRAQIAEALS